MSFNSIHFIIFLPVVFFIHWIIKKEYRWVILLAASYYFYMSWNAKYIVLILFTTLVTYFGGMFIEKTRNEKYRKLLLFITIISCVGTLILFKYLNLIYESIDDIFSLIGIQLHPMTIKLILPVGISFYTFQTLSYVIDVYKGKIEAEHHLGYYATFISFFPQLVAGPIERSSNLLPQIKDNRTFDYEQGRDGMLLMAWGFYKKVVIADTLAIYADKIFNRVYSYKGFSLIVATFFFTIQIYCDFSGYSDIAIGTAKLFGINLMENFRSPYFSASIKEFWSRWHISLSTWLRDYIYIPLGGNRVTKIRYRINLIITFLVSGLWHGANKTFVLWGGVHGLGYVAETIYPWKNKNRIIKGVQIIIVFIFVSAAWVLFRTQNFMEAFHVYTHMFSGIENPVRYLYKGYRDIYMPVSLIKRTCIMLVLLIIHDILSMKYNIRSELKKIPTVPRWALYLGFVWMLVAFMPIGADQDFIYFQF